MRALFVVSIAINCWIIWRLLHARFSSAFSRLISETGSSVRLISGRSTDLRERALQQRTLRLAAILALLLGYLLIAALLYLPTLLLARWQFELEAAFWSVELLLGFILAALMISIRRKQA